MNINNFLNQALCFFIFSFHFKYVILMMKNITKLWLTDRLNSCYKKIDHFFISCFSHSFQYLPKRLWSMHVPLTNDFPSGQAHDAPDGLSKQMNSHVRPKHGLGTVSEEKIFLKYIFCIWYFFFFLCFCFRIILC